MLQILGVVELQIPHPGGTAAGEHGERPAVLQPLQKLLRLQYGGHIRAEVGVVHLVHTHELQRRGHLVNDVHACRDAKGLTHRHTDGRRDLHHHTLLRVVDGRPGGADLIVNGDGAGGAHGGALAAAHALRLAQLFVKGRHHLQLAAPEGKVQNALALQFLAHPHTVAAQDALVSPGTPRSWCNPSRTGAYC